MRPAGSRARLEGVPRSASPNAGFHKSRFSKHHSFVMVELHYAHVLYLLLPT